MFEQLGQQLQDQFRQLTGKGVLSEKDIDKALADVRLHLLAADVALPVAGELIARIKQAAVGQKILQSIRPGDQVVKIVHDNLVALLAPSDPSSSPLEKLFKPASPHIIMLVGLQGSGKTTSAVKLAHFLTKKKKAKVLVASLDIYRPAAQEQLAIFAEKSAIASLPVVKDQAVLAIAARAVTAAKKESYDYLILDTAGRLVVDKPLMAEVAALKKNIKPQDSLLVLDGLSGQSAIDTARAFHQTLDLTGAIMTRMDGDARGGAALSLRHETNCPLLFLGSGEAVEKLDTVDPVRLANQILGMGDIVSLVEKAQEISDEDEMAAMEARLKKGIFTLDDFQKQLRQMKKMGGMKEILSKLPQGILPQNMKNIGQMNLDDTLFARQDAIINSMTKQERRKPDIILAGRKNRIAKGAGVTLADVNRLLKQFLTTQKMMKQAAKMDPATMARQMNAMKGQMQRRF